MPGAAVHDVVAGAAAATVGFADSPDYVQSLQRGLAVIRVFDSAHTALTLSEVAERAGLSRAVARRLLMTLEYLGYARRQGRQSSLTVAELSQPFMEEVVRQIDESCSLAVLDAHDIVYVQRVAVRKVMTITLGIGARLPAFCTSMGRMLLAGLEEEAFERWLRALRPQAATRFTQVDKAALRAAVERTRAQGYSYVEQELQEGLCSVAVPVRDERGTTIAALNAGMPFRVGARSHALKKVLPALRAGARSIERSLSARPLGAASISRP
jgi:IclR family pca regulon transcriptional regulator